ncbi:hypothetical protein CEXT_668701 [Caerostris extrusa]|uniref:Uncharacterized protein n=1 Tax=Caerostris extrusa TaxID=172846 RepID=A0AAV4T816_CAEEX|nr:hypothetical protein CEXT_668701 [Caerostris extrusa]
MRRQPTFPGLILRGYSAFPPPTYSLGYSQSILIPRCYGNSSPAPAFIRLISRGCQIGEFIAAGILFNSGKIRYGRSLRRVLLGV